MTDQAVEIEVARPVAWIWMNRPAVHNACDEALIEQLTAAYLHLEQQPIRVIVLAGRGANFSAGADIGWMKRQGMATTDANLADARLLADLFGTVARSTKPTVARVHGKALGAGVGLIAACDIAIGSSDASLGLPEVRLGLIPATIAPYVLRAIGERHARRLFQTGERIDATTAERIGLLHQVVPSDQLDKQLDATISSLLAGAPQAQAEAKALIDAVANQPISPPLIEDTAQRIAFRRAQPEAKEGLTAFLEKRSAAWVPRP
jgi:methylglutaconyl-CoA hydratase